MSRRPPVPPELPLEDLGISHLAQFVGQRCNELVLAELHRAGFETLRVAHGYLIQHVVAQSRSIGELAERMGVSQQAASKAVSELVALGYLESAPADDARVRRVQLSPRGREALKTARRVRVALEKKAARGLDAKALRLTRRTLSVMLGALGGVAQVQARRVPDPELGQPPRATRRRGRET